jgi:hypothetical protein
MLKRTRLFKILNPEEILFLDIIADFPGFFEFGKICFLRVIEFILQKFLILHGPEIRVRLS